MAKMKKKSMAKMKKAPSKFNAKLKAASAAGKLSGKFKEAVDAAPVKFERKSVKKKKERLKELNEKFGQKGRAEKGAVKMKKKM